MTRRSFHITALCTAALLVGVSVGGVSNLARAQVQLGDSAQPSKSSPPGATVKEKGGAGATCKLTADCQPDYICAPVGDHKECRLAPIKAPVQTSVT